MSTEQNTIPTHELARGDSLDVPFRFVDLDADPESYDSSRPHRHDYVEVFWFESGGGVHELDFDALQIGDRTMHIVRAGQVHRVSRAPGCRGSVLLFDADFLSTGGLDADSSVPAFDLLPSVIGFDDDLAALVRIAIDGVRRESASDEDGALELVRSYLRSLILLMTRRADSLGEIDDPESIEVRFVRMLDRSFRTEHSPGFYADSLGLTRGHLNVVLKDSLGRTTSDLIRDRVMLEARRMLAHSDTPVGDIAWHLGFEDPSYFTRLFKRHCGMTPAAFRGAILG